MRRYKLTFTYIYTYTFTYKDLESIIIFNIIQII